MNRKAALTKAGKSTQVLRQLRNQEMAADRKGRRADAFSKGRTATTTEQPETLEETLTENAPFKKNLKDSLQKWREEKQRRLEQSKQKMNRGFVVTKRVETTPAQALPIVKPNAYKNVAPRVETRRAPARNAAVFTNVQVPSKFNFSQPGNAKVAKNPKPTETHKPFVFAAPPLVHKKSDSPLKPLPQLPEKKASFSADVIDKSNAPAITPRKFPVTPRPSTKSGSKIRSVPSRVKPLAPVKQFIADSPSDSPVKPPPAKKRKTNEKVVLDVPKIVVHDIPSSSSGSPSNWYSCSSARTNDSGLKSNNPQDGMEEDMVHAEPAASGELPKVAPVVEPMVESDTQELSADYFRQILDNEINALEQSSAEWESELMPDLPEFAEEKIRLATGMAHLLIREKFAQFRGLINNCDQPQDEKFKTLLSDLQGFWDMIKIQADKIHGLFEEIARLKKNAWTEEKPMPKKKAPPKKKAAPTAAKGPTAARNSKFKEFLAKQRQANGEKAAPHTPVAKKEATPKAVPKTPSSISKHKVESPNVNALINVSIIAKSAERKSVGSGDRSFTALMSPLAQRAQPKTAEPRTSTPSSISVKQAEPMPAITKGSKCVLFDIIPEEEDEVSLAIPPVKHTYAQKHYELSPPKDKFDELFEEPKDKFDEMFEEPIETPVLGSGKRGQKTVLKTPLQPVRRSTRLTSLANSPKPSQDQEEQPVKPKARKSRKNSVAQETPTLDDQNVSVRRSSRKRTLNEKELGTDLMNFSTPTVSATKRKRSVAKRTILDESL